MTELQNAIKHGNKVLEEKIEDLKSQQITLQALSADMSPSEVWKTVCGTALWSTPEVLENFAKALIPGGEKYKYENSSIYITYKNIDVFLPVTNKNDIISLYYRGHAIIKPPQMPVPSEDERLAQQMAEALKKSAPLGKQLELRAPHLHPMRRYYLYFTLWRNRDKELQRDAEFYENRYEELKKKRVENFHKECKEYVKFTQSVKTFYREFYPALSKFAGNEFTIFHGKIV